MRLGVRKVTEDSGRLGGVKKEHTTILTESKAIVVPDLVWNFATS